MKGKIRTLSKITRMLNVTVVGFIAIMLAFIAISVNCEEEIDSKNMFIKPDRIILNANSEVNDVIAQFPFVGGCPPDGTPFVSQLTLSIDGVFLDPIPADSYHYCLDDDVLQVCFDRQAVQYLVDGEAGIYTTTVTFDIVDEISIVGEDDSVEMIKPGKSGK